MERDGQADSGPVQRGAALTAPSIDAQRVVGARCTNTARLPLGLVLGVAVVVRVGWWVWSDGPRYGGDSRQYLTWAAMLAGGDLSVARDWLFHLVYPLTLAPMYLLRLPEGPYVFALHMLASVGSV